MTKAEIQLVRALADKRARTEHGLFVAEGSKIVGEIGRSHLRIRKIFALEGVAAGGATFGGTAAGAQKDSGAASGDTAAFGGAASGAAPVEIVSPREMERLSLLKSPPDMLALVEIPRYELDIRAMAGRLTLALDDVQNPGNMGTIIRLADWFGIMDVVCSEASADCFNPKVVQASMGAILRVRVHYTDLGRFLQAASAEALPLFAAAMDGENIYDSALTAGAVVVMGNEGRGLSDDVARHISRKLFIPPWPVGRQGSESLNVAIATGIVCAEFRRQASKKQP